MTITGKQLRQRRDGDDRRRSGDGCHFRQQHLAHRDHPAHAAGTVDVVVTNPDAQTGTLTNGYTYDAQPTVTNMSPASGPIAGNTSVTITGTNFVSGATVTIGGVAATNVTFVKRDDHRNDRRARGGRRGCRRDDARWQRDADRWLHLSRRADRHEGQPNHRPDRREHERDDHRDELRQRRDCDVRWRRRQRTSRSSTAPRSPPRRRATAPARQTSS